MCEKNSELRSDKQMAVRAIKDLVFGPNASKLATEYIQRVNDSTSCAQVRNAMVSLRRVLFD